MGCCENKQRPLEIHESLYNIKAKEAIDTNDPKRLSIFYGLMQNNNKSISELIDKEIVKINGKRLNALAYSVNIGSGPIYLKLLELGACNSKMNEMLESQYLRAINIICAKNHSNLLRVYLPIYLQLPQTTGIFEYPVHTACRMNSLGVLNFIYNYFKDKETPEEFSFSSRNDQGETAILIACRFGHFRVVKLLYEHFNCDLSVLNKFKENALLITGKGYNKYRNQKYRDIFIYLIETVKLDLSSYHFELLALVDSGEIFDYLESKLQEIGITVHRSEVFKYSFTLKGLSMATSMNRTGDDIWELETD
jgi:ankyrin repeat protein